MSREKVETMAEALKWLETSPKAPKPNTEASVLAPEYPHIGKLTKFMKKAELARQRNRKGKIDVDDV